MQAGTLLRYTAKLQSFNPINILSTDIIKGINYIYWSNPEEKYSFVALGEKKILNTCSIDNRIDFTDIAFTDNNEFDIVAALPSIIFSRKFCEDKKEKIWSDFVYAKWFIPQIILVRKGDEIYLSLFFERDEDINRLIDSVNELLEVCPQLSIINSKILCDPIYKDDKDDWINIINSATQKIADGSIKKVVLARRLEFEVKGNFSVPTSIQMLESNYSNCTTYAFKQNESIIIGATPERLFTISDGIINTDALAGSIGRGDTPDNDLLLENELLMSSKNLSEHDDVFRFLIDKLEPLTSELIFNSKPTIKKLNNIQHLWTPITGRLKQGITIDRLINEIHPTPAVCGLPQQYAFDLIAELENFDRGLYTGVLGWLNENGNGEFVVALRNALLNKNKLYAYAGSGIVKESDPISELIETDLKFRPILSLLENDTLS